MKYSRYKRGSLVMVNFTPSVGSELKNNHLAIVLTKKDSPNNAVLTVVPLSSKSKPYYLNLGNFIWSNINPSLSKTVKDLTNSKESIRERLSNLSKIETEELRKKSEEELYHDYQSLMHNLDEYFAIMSHYNNKNTSSYALVQNITTNSKTRILKPINKYDPIKDLKVPDEILDRIDQKLIELFISKI